MTTHLFVYGTLAPGRPNEHVLAGLDGTWRPATMRGSLHQDGWGAALGYPGIVLDDTAGEVEGYVFSSDGLPVMWAELDEFEGAGYEHVVGPARFNDGTGFNNWGNAVETMQQTEETARQYQHSAQQQE